MEQYSDYHLQIVGDGWVRARFRRVQGGGESAVNGKMDEAAVRTALQLTSSLSSGQISAAEIQRLGEVLWKALFPSEVGAHFLEAFRHIHKIPKLGIRLRFEVDETIDPEAAFLPWEYLRYPGDAHSQSFWFATQPRLVLSRYRPLYEIADAITLDPNDKLRILVAVASPNDMPTVLFEPVWEQIHELPSKHPLFAPPLLIPATTARLLDEGLRDFKPHMVHLLAHGRYGESGQIALLSKDGNTARWYQAQDFASLFESWQPGLILLHSCESAQSSTEQGFAGLASRVVQGNAPVVIAMRHTISNRVAVAFAQEFYLGIARGEPVDASVQLGRRAIGRDFGYESREFATPALFMRVQDGRFFSYPRDAQVVISEPTLRHSFQLKEIRHNLPQRGYIRFVGRREEIIRIRELLAATSDCYLLGIIGTPGVGKTTLALEVAYGLMDVNSELPLQDRFDAIIWSTAQTAVLTARGVIATQQRINTLEDIYTVIAITLKQQDILRARREEQDELIRQALLAQRTLLVIDNYETMDDERAFAFLQAVPPTTKVVLTSRYGIDCPTIVTLDELSPEEGSEFISIECSRRGISLSTAESEQLYSACSGLPLVIVWSLAQIAFGFTLEATLKLLFDAREDLVPFCFGRALDSIRNDGSYFMLLSLSLFTTDSSRVALGEVSGLKDDILERDRALVTLRRLSLINQTDGRFKILPITKRLVEHELETQSQFVTDARRRQIDYYVDFLQRYNPKQEPTPPMEPFWDEIDNVRGLVRWCRASQSHNDLVTLACAYAPFLWTHGLWQELFDIASWTSDAAQDIGDWRALAEINLHAVLSYMDQNNPDKMTELLQLVDLAFRKLSAVPDDLMETYLFAKAAAAVFRRDPGALHLLEEDLSFTRKMGVRWREAGTLYWMGIWAYDIENWAEAEKYLVQVLEIAKSQGDKRTMGLAYSYLPEVLYRLGKTRQAFTLYEETDGFVETNGQLVSKAQFALGMAKVFLGTSRPKEALVQAQKALKIYSNLRRLDRVRQCNDLLANLGNRSTTS